MIKRLSFENYRIFRNKQILDIKPIVIIFGKNNSGKSAVLKLPVIARSSLSNRTAEVIDSSFMGLNFAESYKGLVYNGANKVVSIEIESEDDVKLNYSFFIDDLKSIKTKIDSWSLDNGKERYAFVTGLDGDYHQADTNDPVSELSFNGVMPSESKSQEFFKSNIGKLKYQVDCIGAFRNVPAAYSQLQALTECSGLGGEKNYNHLIADSKTQEKELCQKVSRWYEDNFDGCQITVNGYRSPVYSIEIKHPSLNAHNIVEAGVGIGQSMPIVIRACRACPEPTLIILEEPETHLHPAAHGNLAQLIAESTKNDSNKSYMIETHSINFIMRIRRMIAEGLLSVADVAMYYVEYDTETSSSNLRSVDVREDGSVSYWPKGVFEETLQETIAIKKAQILK